MPVYRCLWNCFTDYCWFSQLRSVLFAMLPNQQSRVKNLCFYSNNTGSFSRFFAQQHSLFVLVSLGFINFRLQCLLFLSFVVKYDISFMKFHCYFTGCCEHSLLDNWTLFVSLSSPISVLVSEQVFPLLFAHALLEFAAFPSSSARSPAVMDVFLKYAFFTSACSLEIFFSFTFGLERRFAHTAFMNGSLSRKTNILCNSTRISSDFGMYSSALLPCRKTVVCWSPWLCLVASCAVEWAEPGLFLVAKGQRFPLSPKVPRVLASSSSLNLCGLPRKILPSWVFVSCWSQVFLVILMSSHIFLAWFVVCLCVLV